MTAKSSSDLSRFNAVFFEECAENLADMERILLGIDTQDPDPEELNAIFRAAHSIKGGSGIFGFEDMAEVTHLLESLLDRLRNREMALAAELVDLVLEAGDVISLQLAGHRDGAPVPPEKASLIREKLNAVVGGGGQTPDSPRPAVREAPAIGERHFRLTFTPDPEIFRRGVRMEGIVAELAEMGTLSVRAELAEVPDLSDCDPQRCITRWTFDITCSATMEELQEVFMFVAEDEELVVVEVPAADEVNGGGTPLAPPAEVAGGWEDREPHQPEGPRVVSSAPAAKRGSANDADSSIRVNVAKVDQLINQVGELLITQAMLLQTASEIDPVRYEALHRGLAQLERNSRDLQQSVMSIRLVPISLVFSRFPRIVRDLAGRLGKQVELQTLGGTTELDKNLIEKVADPLSHLVRNALDHGLETPEARRAAGKPETGTIRLKAAHVGGRIVVEVSDDGQGLNRERILAKAREQGIPVAPDLPDEEVWQLIFAPGFSTAAEVTDLSGRGVGMDVVLKNVQAIGGRVQITSEAGKGARVSISLPLTLAIQEALCVAVGRERFLVPLNAVIESLQPRREQILTLSGREVVQLREDYLPVVPLHRLYGIPNAVQRPEEGIVILVESEGEKAALLVDVLLDQLQVVVKSIETNFRKVEGSSGATILGDGMVALILDITELLALHKKAGE